MKLSTTLSSILITGFLALGSAAQAAPFIGTTAALQARDALVAEFTDGKSNTNALAALDEVVEANLDTLARVGSPELAERYRKAWKREFARSLRASLYDMGDHEPLSRLLTEIVAALRDVLGKNSKYEALLADAETMNYAIPIVFNPRGDWRKKDAGDDREEYGEHFVPFAGIVTYYASITACRRIAAAKGMGALGKRLCPRIAQRLEKEMSTRLAPKLSDFIFNKANGLKSALRLMRRDYIYTNERSLEQALR